MDIRRAEDDPRPEQRCQSPNDARLRKRTDGGRQDLQDSRDFTERRRENSNNRRHQPISPREKGGSKIRHPLKKNPKSKIQNPKLSHISGRMDEDKDELPPFRWNWQAVFMLFFTMAALAIPFGGIVWFLRGYLYAQEHAAHVAASSQPAARPTAQASVTPSPVPAPTAAPQRPPVDAAALTKSLEHAAESQMGSETRLEDENSSIRLALPADQIGPRIERIKQIATSAGGNALEMTPDQPGGGRLMVQVPDSRADLLRRAIQGDKVDFTSIPASPETTLIDIQIDKK
jgi:hypothetical protein